jgi:hypothetical protein
MDYSKARKVRSERSFPAQLRVFVWRLLHRRKEPVIPLDPQTLPDHILQDIGLPAPNRARDETTAFWR